MSRSWRNAGREETWQEFAFCLKMLPQVAGRWKSEAPDRQLGVEKRQKGLFCYTSEEDYMFKQLLFFFPFFFSFFFLLSSHWEK